MSAYLWVKLIHIVSATILFGTGIGTAYFMLKAYLSENDDAFAVTTRNVVQADWLFTTPAIVVQLASGIWLTRELGIEYSSAWFIAVIGLFAVVGACWIPVVWIQIRIRDLVAEGADRASYRRLATAWAALGVPAFAAVLLIFYLMVSKVGVY